MKRNVDQFNIFSFSKKKFSQSAQIMTTISNVFHEIIIIINIFDIYAGYPAARAPAGGHGACTHLFGSKAGGFGQKKSIVAFFSTILLWTFCKLQMIFNFFEQQQYSW